MTRVALKGRVVTDYEVWEDGVVLVEDGAILDVLPSAAELPRSQAVSDYGESLILPGFVDLQVNGSFGIDVATSPERLPELSRKLTSTGTTSFLPTVITSPENLYERTLPALSEVMSDTSFGTSASGSDGATALGVHLEGPFLALDRKGAHPAANVLPPDVSFLERLLAAAPTRLLTLAPELDGAETLMELARNRGVVVSAGHSDSTFEIAYDSLDRYASSVTHLFNAMSQMQHRAPGLPGAAFAHPRVVCGVIADGIHVHTEMINLAFRMLGPDRIYLVTDSIAAAGMGPGEYQLATRRVYCREDGVPRLGNGAIAGSVLNMNEAFRNILAFTGCTIPEAARMSSSTPARLVGEGRRKGRLFRGYDADITVLATNLSVRAVFKNGRQTYSR